MIFDEMSDDPPSTTHHQSSPSIIRLERAEAMLVEQDQLVYAALFNHGTPTGLLHVPPPM
jgi:hypothetical protein